MSNMPALFQVILLSLIATFVCTPAGIWLARRLGLIDYPGSAPHKHHERPTPMAGGIILVLAFAVVSNFFQLWEDPFVRPAFVASMVIFAFGLWDDRQKLAAFPKLIGQLLAAAILIQGGIFVQVFESPEFLFDLPFSAARGLDIVVTFLWLTGITNAFNFIDSMDGLAVGIGGMVAAFFMLLTLDAGQFSLAKFSAALAAICMGIYFFNVRPARFFLGDGGAQVLGFWLAVLAIVFRPLDVNQMSSWFVTVLLFGVPIFDMLLVMFSRLRRKRPVFASARDHTYHRLLSFGVQPDRIVLFLHLVAISLGCLAIISLHQPPLAANVIFAAVVFLGAAALVFLEATFKNAPEPEEDNLTP